MSDSNRVQLGVAAETVAGTIDSTPYFYNMCHTGPGLAANPQFDESEAICGGAGRAANVPGRTSNEPGGNIPFEFTFGNLSQWWEPLFFSTWTQQNFRTNRGVASDQITDITSDEITVSSGTAFASGDLVLLRGFNNDDDGLYILTTGSNATTVAVIGSLTDDASPPATAEIRKVGVQAASGDIVADATGLTSTTLDFTTLGLAVGDWIKVGDDNETNGKFDSDTYNDWIRISAISANNLDSDTLPVWLDQQRRDGQADPACLSATRSPTALRSLPGPSSRRSSTNRPPATSTTPAASPPASLMAGTAARKLTGTIDLLARGFSSTTSRTANAAAGFVGKTTSPYFTSGVGAQRIAENGSRLSDPEFVSNFTLEIANSLRRRSRWGVDGTASIGTGDFTVTGSFEVDFETLTFLNKVQNETETSLDNVLVNGRSEAIVFDLPRVRFIGGDPSAGARNSDVTLPMQYSSHQHETLGYVCKVQRFHACATPAS